MKHDNKYTRSAKGQPCSIRLGGCCPGPDNENVSAAHITKYDNGGMGGKPLDIHIAYACHRCHNKIDGISWYLFLPEMLRGMKETQASMVRRGILKI